MRIQPFRSSSASKSKRPADGCGAADHELLQLATSLDRHTVTQDIRFRVLAEDWQRSRRRFTGLVFAHQRYVSFGQVVQ
jgi:hypothetical protein